MNDSFVINMIAGDVVEPARRTAIFGKLQGCIMLGEGIGFLGTEQHQQSRTCRG